MNAEPAPLRAHARLATSDNDFSTSEQYRHQCEVRTFLRLKAGGRGALVMPRLALIEKHRGREAMQRIVDDAREQGRLGNVGERGDWRGDDVSEMR